MLHELTIIAPEDITGMGIEQLTRILKRHATEVLKIEDDGVKRLAYPITTHNREHERGRYLYYELDLESGVPARISSELNITDDVIRYILVRADTNVRR